MAIGGQHCSKQLFIIGVIISILIIYAVFETNSDYKEYEDFRTIFQYGKRNHGCGNMEMFTVLPAGNLGNQIWEYMSLFAITSMYKLDLKYKPCINQRMKEMLESTFESLSIPWMKDCEVCLRNHPKKVISKSKPFQAVGELPAGYNLLLEQYSARYEDIIEFGVDNIRKELRFKEDLIIYAETTLSAIKSHLNLTAENVTFVGMHYRGTDYPAFLRKYHGNLFKGPSDYNYYRNAMEYFTNVYKNVVFILISIDEDWLGKNVPFIEKNFTVVANFASGEPNKDLCLLSHCNHTIINYGTYGVTAAFLNKGTTFVYDLELPLDHRGQTVALGIARILPNWHIGT